LEETATGEERLWRLFLHWLNADRGGAIALAAWVIHQESLSPEERAKQKSEETERGKREWLESQPATLAQKKLLVSLGYTGEIKNRQHASELINELKTW